MARFLIRVQPRSRMNEVDGKVVGGYRLRLAAPPVDNKANDACLRFLAERLGIRQSAVRILKGHGSRNKLIEVDGMDDAQIEGALLGK